MQSAGNYPFNVFYEENKTEAEINQFDTGIHNMYSGNENVGNLQMIWCTLIVFKGAYEIVQIITAAKTIKIRAAYNGEWSEWKSII